MASFPHIKSSYACNTFEYKKRAALEAAGLPLYPALEDWLAVFEGSIPTFARLAAADPTVEDSETRALRFSASYAATLKSLALSRDTAGGEAKQSPDTNCLELCRLRENALLDAGFFDIFKGIKSEENRKAMDLLPEVLDELDAMSVSAERWEIIVRGVCAANIFDLGAAHTTAMYHENGGVSFHDTRDKLLPRPWVIDDMDSLVARLVQGPPYHKAVIFVDNSGADVVLGILPLARELLRRGCRTVILAANELPSVNDITAAELDAMLPVIAAVDDVICKAISSQRLRVLSSGNGLPVIDLSNISAELAEEARDADLVVLEGMGRGIETNLRAELEGCDVLKIGMVKHPEVAACLGGRMLDCVVKFDERSSN